MMRANARVQSFPSPNSNPAPHDLTTESDQNIAPKLSKLHGGRSISGGRLANTLGIFMATQESGAQLTTNCISAPNTISITDCNLIRCYLDNNVLLLDACSTIQHSLQSIQRHLGSITVALHYLEGEHEPSPTVLKRTAAALESCDFKNTQNSIKLEKCMSKLRTFGKKLGNHGCDSISPKLYRALSGSLSMGVLAVGMLGSAATYEPRIQTAAMEELAGTASAAKALLKLVSAWQKDGRGYARRAGAKAVAEELRRMREELEKALLPLEEKIGELYRQLIDFRMRLLEFLSEARKEEVVLELGKPVGWKKGQMEINPAQKHEAASWVTVKQKSSRRSWSHGEFCPHFLV